MTLATVSGVAALAALAHFAPHVLRVQTQRRLIAECAQNRSLVLTYDDGPGTQLTPKLLALLGEAGAKASFLLLGMRIGGNELIVDRIAAEGHEIGCHGQHHLNAWKTWPWRIATDVRRGYESIERWAGPRALFRPPYGKLSWPAWIEVRRRGARLAWWTIDSGDTHAELPRPESIAEAVSIAGGGVVLMHDFDREARRIDYVLRTTELLLKTAAREGLHVCRYSDLFRNELANLVSA